MIETPTPVPFDAGPPDFDLEAVIAQDQLVLRYQPIVDLHDDSLFAVEALLRWMHPTHGELLPAAFLGQIRSDRDHRELDLWVLNRAMQEVAILPPAFGSVALSINVGAEHLGAPNSIADLVAAIARSDFDPRRLIVELTESSALRDTAAAVSRIDELKRAGVRFAIDDFGTGCATLDYLARLPADFLKIDRSFIAAFREEKRAAIVEAVLMLARRFDIAVVVEGIEREEQLDFARSRRARYAQGFFLGRPLPLAALFARAETPARHRRDVRLGRPSRHR